MPRGNYHQLRHTNCFEHALLIGVTKICVKEAGRSFIRGLDNSSNDECTSASIIQNDVYNYTNILFPLAMVHENGKDIG